MTIDMNELRAGEIYVATIQIAGQAPYRLILLPDHLEDEMTHQTATEWAGTRLLLLHRGDLGLQGVALFLSRL